MFNTIILKKGEASLTKDEMKSFNQGDTIWGADREPEEIKRWSMEQEAEAKTELAKHKCSYNEWSNGTDIKEYALEYCECDEDGECINGSDYDLAAEEEEN